MNFVTKEEFLKDSQGLRFKDVNKDAAVGWPEWIDWLNNADRQSRLEIAETHFGMPALAGILKELEGEAFVKDYFRDRTPNETLRVNQALGVLVRMHMGKLGWQPAGRKGPLGRRDKEARVLGYHNSSRSFSHYFLSAERYEKIEGKSPDGE